MSESNPENDLHLQIHCSAAATFEVIIHIFVSLIVTTESDKVPRYSRVVVTPTRRIDSSFFFFLFFAFCRQLIEGNRFVFGSKKDNKL